MVLRYRKDMKTFPCKDPFAELPNRAGYGQAYCGHLGVSGIACLFEPHPDTPRITALPDEDDTRQPSSAVPEQNDQAVPAVEDRGRSPRREAPDS